MTEEKREALAAALRNKFLASDYQTLNWLDMADAALAALSTKQEAGNGEAAIYNELLETRSWAAKMAAEAALLAELVEGFLACPEIADCAPEDKDPDTHELERRARAILRGDAQGLVAGADGKGGKP